MEVVLAFARAPALRLQRSFRKEQWWARQDPLIAYSRRKTMVLFRSTLRRTNVYTNTTADALIRVNSPQVLKFCRIRSNVF